MKKAVTLAMFFAVLLVSKYQAQQNTILIIADDLGTDWCGFYEDRVDTAALPNIRKLLSKGVRFQQAMSNPVCSSTRSGLFTGRYSFRTGVGNIVGGTGGSGSLDTAEISIPKLLKQHNSNIATAQVGKWHLQLQLNSTLLNPNYMGYNYFAGMFNGAITDYYNWSKITNGVASTSTVYATTEITNDGISWIRSQTTKPFFLWMAFNAPHSPYHLPPAGFYNGPSLPGTTAHINANPKKYFKAALEALDHEIGRLLDSLISMNKLDSTNFIVMGDNGNASSVAQNGSSNKGKGTVYQYGVHVPFIISGPCVNAPGRLSSALVNTTDVFATILELFGNTGWSQQIPSTKPVDSKSLLAILKNTGTQIRNWSFCEMFKNIPDSADGKAIRNLDYKLIRFDNGKEEFYSLLNDPSETLNLLQTGLSASDISNYNYLCNELTNLIGAGTYCTGGLGISSTNINNTESSVGPNPFSKYIQLPSGFEHKEYSLYNSSGLLIYHGTEMETQDFSSLPRGLYFLYDSGSKVHLVKLMKH